MKRQNLIVSSKLRTIVAFGSIHLMAPLWIPGDSRLLPEQLEMPQPDAILFDFNDNAWHIGFENAVKLANTYPHAELILSHWGTVDAPHIDAFNGDPEACTIGSSIQSGFVLSLPVSQSN